jgi:hypothetical protein
MKPYHWNRLRSLAIIASLAVSLSACGRNLYEIAVTNFVNLAVLHATPVDTASWVYDDSLQGGTDKVMLARLRNAVLVGDSVRALKIVEQHDEVANGLSNDLRCGLTVLLLDERSVERAAALSCEGLVASSELYALRPTPALRKAIAYPSRVSLVTHIPWLRRRLDALLAQGASRLGWSDEKTGIVRQSAAWHPGWEQPGVISDDVEGSLPDFRYNSDQRGLGRRDRYWSVGLYPGTFGEQSAFAIGSDPAEHVTVVRFDNLWTRPGTSIEIEPYGEMVGQALQLVEGQRYRLSFDYKTDAFGLTKPMVAILDYSPSVSSIVFTESLEQTYGTWRNKSVAFTAPGSDVPLRLVFRQSGVGAVWFDKPVISNHQN